MRKYPHLLMNMSIYTPKSPNGELKEKISSLKYITKTMNIFISGSHFESIAMTMVMIIFPLLLQTPSRNSKCKEHKEHLSRRLEMWRTGQLHKLLKECTTIQLYNHTVLQLTKLTKSLTHSLTHYLPTYLPN